MLTSVAPNGTPATPEPEYIVVPIDDKWKPQVGDKLRCEETYAARCVTRVIAGICFEYTSGGASFTAYPQNGSYAKSLIDFECFRPVEPSKPTIKIPCEIMQPGITLTPLVTPHKPANPYLRKLRHVKIDDGAAWGDVYSFLLTYDVTCPATQHAIKKLACAGTRGSKSREQDLREALAAVQAAIEIEAGKS